MDGKFFSKRGERFPFRGVTYGTFAPGADGSRFPETDRVKLDFAQMCRHDFTVVRTYTEPTAEVVDLAADWGLHLLAGVFFPDWRYVMGGGRRHHRRVVKEARQLVRLAAQHLAGADHVLGLVLANEVPADVLRWYGTQRVAQTIAELAEVAREEDPELLVTYANYPTTEYLQLDTLDFLTFNVFLEHKESFRQYLTKLQHLAGDRPLVLGEMGMDASTDEPGERYQAEVVDWQLEVAVDRGVAGTCLFAWTDEWWVGDAAVEGWHFGLTRADRTPRHALEVAAWWNRHGVRDLDFDWPSISVVICAWNAEATLEECLEHTCALDYPLLEIIVVDDGSTDSTPEIAARHPRVRLISITHVGLSAARNEGLRSATGELIAYLDSDAYPTPEWPYYLALGLDRSDVGGVGGPNLPPLDDPLGAQVVARAPGGPVHVLTDDNRAEHIPGCNMAFWRKVLDEVGGFDPVYTSAGDDVDLCWKVLDHGWQIGFHPAALVWHHRRPGLRPYLRQQRGYGRSEALVEARHPDRFTPTGTARWRGRIYDSFAPSFGRSSIYRGTYGTAAYQSIYRGGGYGLDLAHQIGVPIAVLTVLTAPVGLALAPAALPALAAAGFLLTLGLVDAVRATPGRRIQRNRLWFRVRVAVHHLCQPVVRAWGRSRSRAVALHDLPDADERGLPPLLTASRAGVTLIEEDRPRAELAEALVRAIRRTGTRVLPPSGWEDHDARLYLSQLVAGDLLTSSHPEGFVHVRVRNRLRRSRAALVVGSVAVANLVAPVVAVALAGAAMLSAVHGLIRSRSLLVRVLRRPAGLTT